MVGSLVSDEMIICEDRSKKEKCIPFKTSMERKEELDDEELAILTKNSSSSSTKIQMEENEKLAKKKGYDLCASNVENQVTSKRMASPLQRWIKKKKKVTSTI